MELNCIYNAERIASYLQLKLQLPTILQYFTLLQSLLSLFFHGDIPVWHLRQISTFWLRIHTPPKRINTLCRTITSVHRNPPATAPQLFHSQTVHSSTNKPINPLLWGNSHTKRDRTTDTSRSWNETKDRQQLLHCCKVFLSAIQPKEYLLCSP